MITTLSGDNTFAISEALYNLTETFIKEYGELALERLDGEEVELSKLEEVLTSLAFLTPKKMVVVKSLSHNKQLAEASDQLINNVSDTTDLILVEPKIDKRLSLYKKLKSKTEFKEYNSLDQNQTSQWLVAYVAGQKGKISLSDARYLIERIGLEQILLKNELDKLVLYNPNITKESIDLLTEPTLQSNIFQLLDAAFNHQTKRLIGLYNEQRAMKVEPPQIIAMISWQLQILAIIKTSKGNSPNQIAKEARLNPFVVNKGLGIAKQLSLIDIGRLTRQLLDIDISSKTNGINLDDALKHYLLELAI
jgi:DNA polymerase-3 subunit delta